MAKIRQGFVSNSSSSSFCILGMIYSDIPRSEEDTFVLEDFGTNELDYEYGIGDYYDEQIIGKSVHSLDPTKTINESKEIIAKEISKISGYEINPSDIKFFVDGGHDG